MDSLKKRELRPRKCSTARQPSNKIAKSKVVKSKPKLEQKKVPLKTIFKRIRNGEDGSSIYMIKDVNEAPINSDVKAAATENNATDYTSIAKTICTHIPDFTTEDIAALIDCSDLASFINFDLENNGGDDASALLSLQTSTPNINCSTIIDDVAKNTLQSHFHQFTETNKYESSSQTSHSAPTTQTLDTEQFSVPMVSIPTICSSDQYGVDTTRNKCEVSVSVSDENEVGRVLMAHNQCETNVEHSASTNINGTADNKCASATPYSKARFEKITINERHAERFVNAKKEYLRLVPPAKLLQEMLRQRKLTPVYRYRVISHSTFQCHVGVNNQNAPVAYGTGELKEDAKNSAALALLDKLISVKYFGNAIGQLQELCASINWPLPKYTDEITVRARMKNEHIFVVGCSVKHYREFGQGRSKKMAKIFAAYKMWCRLTGRN